MLLNYMICKCYKLSLLIVLDRNDMSKQGAGIIGIAPLMEEQYNYIL
jgi:hypothetical protein